MLADLEYLNFSLQKLDILKRQLFFLHDLDSDFLAGLFVLSSLHKTIFTLSEGFLQLVKVVEVGISNGLLNLFDPLVSLNQSIKVIDSSLVWENEHEWIKSSGIIL